MERGGALVYIKDADFEIYFICRIQEGNILYKETKDHSKHPDIQSRIDEKNRSMVMMVKHFFSIF